MNSIQIYNGNPPEWEREHKCSEEYRRCNLCGRSGCEECLELHEIIDPSGTTPLDACLACFLREEESKEMRKAV